MLSISTICKAEAPIVDCLPKYDVQHAEAIKLANKVIAYDLTRPEYDRLQYTDPADLLETCKLAVTHESGKFNRYILCAIWIRESRLYRKAYNRRDGGKGIAMVMKRYWKEELPWYNDPYNKGQSTKACVEVLNLLYEKHKNVPMAIKYYNGSCDAAERYSQNVLQISKQLAKA